ncbi:MAG: hypothetical protein IPO38_03595 [Rhodocyclaceae bacterium]|nr:hypothetical protein [Rhodocyclaceae bacterium]
MWTYTANNAQNQFAGTTYTDAVNVTSADGTSSITVSIVGTNEPHHPHHHADGDQCGIDHQGTMVITDVDSATTFTALTAVAGNNSYGTFSMSTAGVWTYTANNAQNSSGRQHLHRCSQRDQCRWHHQQHHGEHPRYQ